MRPSVCGQRLTAFRLLSGVLDGVELRVESFHLVVRVQASSRMEKFCLERICIVDVEVSFCHQMYIVTL